MYLILYPMLLLVLCLSLGQAASVTYKLPSQLPDCPAKYLTDALIASDGAIWVSSETQGVYRLSPSNAYHDTWTSGSDDTGYPQYATNVYCMAEDLQKRIWIGTDNQGVAVFNGSEWIVYNRENALLGERIFDIAVSPLSGDVAIATSAGVNIYQPTTDSWKSLTRANGLVENQVQSLCYQQDGVLWLAYACGGISKVLPQKDYMVVQSIQSPWHWDQEGLVRQPTTAEGSGLPSNLCNVITTNNQGHVWVGTNNGLAYCLSGREWKFIRGQDFKAKNAGVYGTSRKNSAELPAQRKSLLLPEDFITALASSPDGLWVGMRERGICLWSPENGVMQQVPIPKPMQGWAISSLLTFPDGSLAASSFGGGISLLHQGSGTWSAPDTSPNKSASFPSFPIHDQPGNMQPMQSSPKALVKTAPALYYTEDWTTQGDWCGAYGNIYGLLCAANAPMDSCHYVSRFAFGKRKHKMTKTMSQILMDYSVQGFMGMHQSPGDSLRSWVHWVTATDNRNVLYCPTDAVRTAAEWNDHGEAYPATFDGPDIWIKITMSEGLHSLDLYFYNPNGRERSTAKRDYLIEIKKNDLDFNQVEGAGISTKSEQANYEKTITSLYKIPTLARARVNHFSGSGVYKRFLISQEGTYWVKITRNHSFNTILNGLFISKIHPPSVMNQAMLTWGLPSEFAGVSPLPPDIDPTQLDHQSSQFVKDWDACMQKTSWTKTSLDQWHTTLLNQCRYLSSKTPSSLHARLQWELNMRSPLDRQQFDERMAASWQAQQDQSIPSRSKEFVPHGPGTVPFSIKELQQMDALGIDWKQYRAGTFPPPEKSVEALKQFLKSSSKS